MYEMILYFYLTNGHVHKVHTANQQTFISLGECQSYINEAKQNIQLRPEELGFNIVCAKVNNNAMYYG